MEKPAVFCLNEGFLGKHILLVGGTSYDEYSRGRKTAEYSSILLTVVISLKLSLRIMIELL